MHAGGAVYRGYTQAQLDAQYDQRTLVPEAPRYMEHWARTSAETRERLPFVTHSYGSGAHETLDLFGAGPPGTLHMHLHGGAWRALSKSDASFVADELIADGARVAVVDFDLAPKTRLSEIVEQIRKAFLWLRANARVLGASQSGVIVSGHSSGAHLAACLLHEDWWEAACVSPADFAGMILASGCYDLEPVRLSARNRYLDLTPETAERLSPIHALPNTLPPIAIFWGSLELDEFQRQSRAFAAQVATRRPELRAEELSGLNHFDVYDTFAEREATITRTARVMSRAAAAASPSSNHGRPTV